MRGLLRDLGRDLSAYPSAVETFRLPLDFWLAVAERLSDEAYANWKVVGWIEGLNDLLFFVDVRAQLARERDRRGFAESLWDDCRRRFYENSYVDEIFPSGEPKAGGLPKRLDGLCRRLARTAVQESFYLVPGLAHEWVASRKLGPWDVLWSFTPDYEQAIPGGAIPIGIDGAALHSSRPRGLQEAGLRVSGNALDVKRGKKISRVATDGELADDQWRYRSEQWLRPGLTLGPTLVYAKDRTPVRVDPTPAGIGSRIRRALHILEEAWPTGAELLRLLTSRIIPLKARGVVSFSYRHRPGLSFINTFDRTPLDLIDDLIHENSHHHLNLLLRKFRLLNGEHTDEIFYSPWRRSLRPVRGILHATFTFTMGAMLFERLASSQVRGSRFGVRGGGDPGLTREERLRARFRCLEEVASVRYSLRDLAYARRLGWLSASGWNLVTAMKREIEKVESRIAPFERTVLHSSHGRALARHRKELARARLLYEPVKPDSSRRSAREETSNRLGLTRG
jgi:HEXXH motif-containing protein